MFRGFTPLAYRLYTVTLARLCVLPRTTAPLIRSLPGTCKSFGSFVWRGCKPPAELCCLQSLLADSMANFRLQQTAHACMFRDSS